MLLSLYLAAGCLSLLSYTTHMSICCKSIRDVHRGRRRIIYRSHESHLFICMWLWRRRVVFYSRWWEADVCVCVNTVCPHVLSLLRAVNFECGPYTARLNMEGPLGPPVTSHKTSHYNAAVAEKRTTESMSFLDFPNLLKIKMCTSFMCGVCSVIFISSLLKIYSLSMLLCFTYYITHPLQCTFHQSVQ